MSRGRSVLLAVLMIGVFFVNFSLAADRGATSQQISTALQPAADLQQSPQAEVEGYLIGPGDILDISVWKDEALTRTSVVRPDGYISFPLVGELPAAGRTAPQVKAEIEKRLKRYMPDVTLSFEIKQVNSMIIYVIGRVNSPGKQILNVDVNVLQALATAGGLNPFARRNEIKILRHGSSETTIYPFQYDEVIDGRRLEQNIYLKRGDVVIVP